MWKQRYSDEVYDGVLPPDVVFILTDIEPSLWQRIFEKNETMKRECGGNQNVLYYLVNPICQGEGALDVRVGICGENEKPQDDMLTE